MSKPLENILMTFSVPEGIPDGSSVWAELSLQERHSGFANAVWKMKNDQRSPDCEEEVARVMATWNACSGVPTGKLGIGALNHAISELERLRREREDLIEVIQFLLRHPDKITPKLAAHAVLAYHGAEVPK